MLRTIAQQGFIACTLLAVLTLAACQAKTAGTNAETAGTGDGASSSGPKTVTLSVMSSSRFLELAKQKFEEQHPGISIEIKEYIAAPKTDDKIVIRKPDTEDSEKDIEKYVNGVSTELMSGKASDLIATSRLPYKKYADKKLLENLSELMKNDSGFHADDYYSNIFDAVKYNGGLYTLPVSVHLNLLLGNRAVLGGTNIDDSEWTWADWKKIVDQFTKDDNHDGIPDISALGNMSQDAMLAMLLDSSYSKFVDTAGKKASFTSKPFIDLLHLCKTLYDTKLVTSDQSSRNPAMFLNFNAMQYEDMVFFPQAKMDGQAEFYNVPTESGEKGTSFRSDLQFAINSKSNNKKEAWEFLKFLLAEEMQSSRELSGFAVNKKASHAREEGLKSMNDPKAGQKGMKILLDGKEFTPKAPEQQDIDRMEQLLNGIRVYAETDPKVLSIVREETAPFFSGQKTADEAAKVIQNKVSTYLQE